MTAVFRHTLGVLRGQALGWGVSFALLGMYAIWAFDTVFAQSSQMTDLYNKMPAEMMAFFGDVGSLTEPGGYLSFALFSYGLVVLGVFAVIVGSGLVAADEEAGRLDLLQSYPISRASLFFGRSAAMLAAIIVVLVIGWAGCLVVLSRSDLHVSAGALALPFVASFGELAVFAALALLLALLLPSRRQGATVAGFVLVASYFVTSLARVNKDLASVARFSPLQYYQGGEAVNGLNMRWLASLLLVAAVLLLAAWRAYERRDLRVSGEGGWRWRWQLARRGVRP